MDNNEHSKEIIENTNSAENCGKTDKTAKYTEEDWTRIREKANEIHQKLALTMDKGAADQAVQDLIAELRQHITDEVCSCTPEILRQIGDLYMFDKRFTDKVDNYRAGFAAFLRKAMYIYCDDLIKFPK